MPRPEYTPFQGTHRVALKTHRQAVDVELFDDGGWYCVKVSRPDRCPTHEEMVEVKHVFFGPTEWAYEAYGSDDDCFDQKRVRLLWQPIGMLLPRPPLGMREPERPKAHRRQGS